MQEILVRLGGFKSNTRIKVFIHVIEMCGIGRGYLKRLSSLLHG